MGIIKSIRIVGFKKFKNFEMDFNEGMNILVGENEAGKSTILEAIEIVLNQKYKTTEKAALQELFNVENISEFEKSPSFLTLPKILIELDLELDPKKKNSESFMGEEFLNKSKGKDKTRYGISFECSFNEELGSGLEKYVSEANIPVEYYDLKWTTYANKSYTALKRPLSMISINTSHSSSANLIFNQYHRNLFETLYSEEERLRFKSQFRAMVEKLPQEIELGKIDDKRSFAIDSKRSVLEGMLAVREANIPLANCGSGVESLIKTEIALSTPKHINVILLEEPEHHLCPTNLRKMIRQIQNRKESSQFIITTHNNLIASHLDLRSVLWIADSGVMSLKRVTKDVADFFIKAVHSSFLQLLLAKKAIIVEGATEALLIPYFYKKIYGHTLEEDMITIISCDGIAYKRYLDAVKQTNKIIAVITDNDQSENKINLAKECEGENIKIFMGQDINEQWTWEACIYQKNRDQLCELIKVDPKAEYKFNGASYGQVLGKMLNNKVETAYTMLNSGKSWEAPDYLIEAFKWVRKE